MKEVGVVGVPDPTAGETVKARIVLGKYRGKRTENDLLAWAREHMAA